MVGLGLSLSASMAACEMGDDVESTLDGWSFAVNSGRAVLFHSRSQLSSVTKASKQTARLRNSAALQSGQ